MCIRDSANSGQSTLCVHGGEHKQRPKVSDAITTPLVLTSSYWFQDTKQLIDFNEGRFNSHEYGRYGNPTVTALSQKLLTLESPSGTTGLDCLFSASGMSSVTTMLLALLPQNGHLIITSDCYRRTRQFIQTFLPKMGVTHTVIDPSDLTTLASTLKSKQVDLFFSESPTNPYLRCVDITAISKLCKESNCLVVIDTTFATPVNLRPLEFGADLVLHSGTKFLAGHNDVLCGAVVGKSSIVQSIKQMHGVLGPVLDPHAAYLVLRGLKTLNLRVKKSNETALTIAKRLSEHPKISRVHYPGLDSHVDHHVAKSHMTGFGGVLSFEVKGEFKETAKFIDALKIPYIAPSLGGVESLVEQPALMSFWNLTLEERTKIGIKDNLVRYSCGIEETEDILQDILNALETL
eukprot:TRINITY_DN10647_c0_g1_i1.p1 TRINITY_DN10647_c0_g1~~TRINITY_DN10647_c0_g1_i1.p1  ORF type:complete len:405 (+),score=61.73 TRINITY_DN10647_c0_g1_i1:3-1217(+)